MQKVKIPWGQWYEQSERTLVFPDKWDIRYQAMPERPELTLEEIMIKMDEPIGTEPLEVLAREKKSACIIIDDISRPTPGDLLLPIVIKKLVACGIDYSHIKVVVALGGHRPMTKQEMQKKVGSWVLEHVQVLNHFPFAADLVTVPDDDQVIKINKNYMDADLRIAVGCIVPHTLAGFSGGAKAVIPGIGGIETLQSNHTLVYANQSESKAFKTSTCDPDNPMRQNMEQIVGKVGLDFIVNVVLNSKMQVADLFAGHFVKAHREACKCAMQSLHTELVPNADIVVLSAYPKDTEYSQVGTCFAVLGHYKEKCVRRDGTIVAVTAASEGAGFHALFGPGMRLFSPHDDNMPPLELHGVQTMVYTEGVRGIDIRQFYTGEIPALYDDWLAVLAQLEEKYKNKERPLVAIYPMGAIQIGAMPQNEGEAL